MNWYFWFCYNIEWLIDGQFSLVSYGQVTCLRLSSNASLTLFDIDLKTVFLCVFIDQNKRRCVDMTVSSLFRWYDRYISELLLYPLRLSCWSALEMFTV